MSKLASKIASTAPPTPAGVKRGPDNCCFPIYGHGDIEDWEALEARRHGSPADGTPKMTWVEIQEYFDNTILETPPRNPLDLTKFKYHWRRFCYCWPDGLRRGR